MYCNISEFGWENKGQGFEKHYKVDPILKIDETFYCSLDLSEPNASGSG